MRSRLSRMSNLLVGKHVVDFHFRLTLFIIVIYVQSFSRSGKRMPGLLNVGCIG